MQTASIDVRAVPWDDGALAQLAQAATPEEAHLDRESWAYLQLVLENAETPTPAPGVAAGPGSQAYLVLAGAEPVAWLALSGAATRWHIDGWAVLPAWKGQGVMTAAVAELQARAEAAGAALTACPAWHELDDFAVLTELGFRPVPHQPRAEVTYLRWPPGTGDAGLRRHWRS